MIINKLRCKKTRIMVFRQPQQLATLYRIWLIEKPRKSTSYKTQCGSWPQCHARRRVPLLSNLFLISINNFDPHEVKDIGKFEVSHS